MDAVMFPQNNDRIIAQQASPIRVIVGNPPYSVGQNSANDNNARMSYPTLDAAIESTYAARSSATLKNSLYDSYVRALRWATDRVGDSGVIAFVTNGGWIDGNTADGIRLSLADEFSSLYVYNLRGNQRTAGELSRKEGGKVFGSNSRNTVAILIAVKSSSDRTTSRIFYRDIGDYLTREDKLAIVADGTLSNVEWSHVLPNFSGDWISFRTDHFSDYDALGDRKPKSGVQVVFSEYSGGLKTNRDFWVYNFSQHTLVAKVRATIDYFASQLKRYELLVANSDSKGSAADLIEYDDSRISWSSGLIPRLERSESIVFDADNVRTAMYRPFCKQLVYFDDTLNDRRGRLPLMFPEHEDGNFGFYVTGAGSDRPFASLMTATIPDLAFWGSSSGQYFPRFTYQSPLHDQLTLDDSKNDGSAGRIDNVSSTLLREYREQLGPEVSTDDIFFYTYGILHSPQYKEEFASDLKRGLPRVPRPKNSIFFRRFATAGRQLSHLHLGYELSTPYPLTEVVAAGAPGADIERYRVVKMSFGSKTDQSTIKYNRWVTINGIPQEAHRYMLGSRSALEWLIDRYQVKTDKTSGIINDPNNWCAEHDNPRYIIDLVKRIVTVSVETMKIVDSLPDLDLA